MLLYICSVLLSSLFFTILFALLNKSLLNPFGSTQKFIGRLKGKKLYHSIIIIIVIGSNIFFMDFFHLGYIQNGILLGIIFSLIEIIFDTDEKESKIKWESIKK